MNNSGFTLVELLVVIAIVSILAGALFMMINPAQMQRKAKEAVVRASTAKLCTALFACAAIKSSSTDCDANDYSEIGVLAPTDPPPPDGAYMLYTNYPFVPDVTIVGAYIPSGCRYTCSFNFSTGVATNLYSNGKCL